MINNKQIAKQINDLMVKHSGEINESVRLVMDNCSGEEFARYRSAAGHVMAEMFSEIINPLYLLHEDIKPEELNPNFIEDIEGLKRKAENGDSNSQLRLGTFYFEGKYVEKNYEEAYKWLNKTSDINDHRVQEKLGYMYENGLGTNQDVEKAIDLYKKSADKGMYKPALRVATYYRNKNEIENAKNWYKKGILIALSYRDNDFEEALKYISE